MSWLKMDDGFAAHPKVAGLTDREFRVWVRTLLYCARYETYGHVPLQAQAEIPGLTETIRARLRDLALVDVDEDGEDLVHEWARFNPPKDEAAAERMRKYRERVRNGKRNAGVTKGVTHVEQF